MTQDGTASRRLEGRVALVTAAGRGIGRGIALTLARHGAKLVLNSYSEDTTAATAQAIRDLGGDVLAIAGDVTQPGFIVDLVQRAEARFGGIDILVNNAGISLFGAVDTEDFEMRWARSFDVLLTAQVRLIRAALPWLRKSSSPRIVNIASTEGLGATRFGSPYTAAKTGVIGLTRSLAVEFGPEGITVNCICPGPINTGMTARIPDEQKAEFARRRTALRRYADPEEVAQMTLSLCLPAASFLTGTAIPVDGGLTIRNA
jgi:3-oxoacyl-[acyl-carrier protein] reductase